MTNIAYPAKFLTLKSLILSVTLHAAVGYFFIFAFPVLAEPHKPNIIFLGSILQKQDVNIYPLKEKNTKTTIIHQNRTREILSEISPTLQNNKKTIVKPFSPSSDGKNNKIQLKSTFSIQAESQSQKKENPPLKVDFSTTPYKPLRLKTHD